MKLNLRDTESFVPNELLVAIVKHAMVKIDNMVASTIITSEHHAFETIDTVTRIIGKQVQELCSNGEARSYAEYQIEAYVDDKIYAKRTKLRFAMAKKFAPAKPAIPAELSTFFGQDAKRYSYLTKTYDCNTIEQTESFCAEEEGYTIEQIKRVQKEKLGADFLSEEQFELLATKIFSVRKQKQAIEVAEVADENEIDMSLIYPELADEDEEEPVMDSEGYFKH